MGPRRSIRILAMSISLLFGLSGGILIGACNANSGDPYFFSIRNDLKVTVVLATCNDAHCSTHFDNWVLRPGGVGSIGVVSGSPGVSGIIIATNGTVMGCLPFMFQTRPDVSLEVGVSKRVPCGSSAGSASVHYQDWPDPNF